MKSLTPLKRVPSCLTALALAVAWTSSTANVAAQALNAQISVRPLTPQEKVDYSLGTAQGASGLATVGLGQPAYLDVLINSAYVTENITNVQWEVTSNPTGLTAELAESPLGPNVPPYKMADRVNLKVAARKMLLAQTAGQYTVKVTLAIQTSANPTVLTQVITAGKYMGVSTCILCHSGSQGAPNIYDEWVETGHATFFTREIDGGADPATSHYASYCISCHTAGYDVNTNAVNDGFDDIAKKHNWKFPTVLTNGNWAAMPAELQDVANIQCENCHGAGSEHAIKALSDPAGSKKHISVTYASGDCSQCHDSMPYHWISKEWGNSRHAVATRSPSGRADRAACVRCHTASGFADFVQDGVEVNTNTVYEAITCSACHDPHNDTNPNQLRVYNNYTLPEGTTVTNAGAGALCMTCHHSRGGAGETNVYNYQRGLPTYAGGSSFGPHDAASGEMIYGVNGITYGKEIPSGSHNATIPDLCVGCHMQSVSRTDPAFTKAGGHTFSMTYTTVSNGVTNVVPKVDVCHKCHGHIEDFNMVRKDYNDDGLIEGIQTEVQKLLDELSTMLPNSTWKSNSADYVPDGQVKEISGRTTVKTNWPTKYLNAAWNYLLVNVEGSHGIHNAPYAVGLLKASIADLSGDSNVDGLADWWQQTYFGDINSLSAKPNASPAGDNIPNWLKFALGLDPNVKVTTVDTSGFVYANGKSIGGGTNTLQIFTAAEISFDTEVGKNYQIQAISNLGGGWQNIGTPIPGTGAALSYVTPTRQNVQQFYRVITQ